MSFKKIRMEIGYKMFGNSIASFFNRSYFGFIRTKIPEKFQNRKITDLGCRDGMLL